MSRIRDGRQGVKSHLQDGRQRGWFHIDNDTLDTYLPIVGMTAWGVYTYLVRRANKLDQCFPSYGTIAKDCGIGRSTAIRSIAKLEAAGLLRVEHRFDDSGDATSHLYTILDGGIEMTLPGHEVVSPGGIEMTPPVVSKGDPKNTHVNKTQIEEIDTSLLRFWVMTLEGVSLPDKLKHDVARLTPRSWADGVLTLHAPADVARRLRRRTGELVQRLQPVAPVALREVRIVNGA